MFEATLKGTYIKLKFSNHYDEIEEIAGKVVNINNRRDLLTLKHDSGKLYHFYNWEVNEIMKETVTQN